MQTIINMASERNGGGAASAGAAFDLSSYSLEKLRKDPQFVLYRGRGTGVLPHILVVAPDSERDHYRAVERLEREYTLRTELDPAWAAIPIALVPHNGRTMLVLKDPGGEPLGRLLDAPLELTRFLQLAIGLATALSRLEKHGIVHRDIKPDNVMVNAGSGQVWLTGFGVSISLLSEPKSRDFKETIAGTLAYMAPEQTGRMNRTTDERSDLYSLGVTLHQMLTGVLPFVASDPLELVHCHIARLPLPLEEHRKDVPAALSAIVLKLLAKIPEERYQTAAGLESDLRRCLQDWLSLGRIEPFALGALDAPNRLTISQKLYGRDKERTALLEAFDRVMETSSPEVV